MGTWGPGIFSNDCAEDVRSEYRELLEDGLSAEDASRNMIESYDSTINDPDDVDYSIFWLALAATQWKCGRLQEDVKRRALKMIDQGADLEYWREDSPKLVGKRELALQKLKEQLLTPQRSPTKIRKPFYQWTEWEVGHLIAYRLLSGKWVLFKVVLIEQYKDKSRTPVVYCCDWVGKELPTVSEIKKLGVRMGPSLYTRRKEDPVKFLLYQSAQSQFPDERIQVVATGLKTKRTNTEGCWHFGAWPELDKFLKDMFGYE